VFIDELVALAQQYIKPWDYSQNGADWDTVYPSCATDHMSPINLIDPRSKYG